MKSIIVREITSLVLRPPTPVSAPVKSTGTHIRFDDSAPSSSSAAKKAKETGEKETNAHARYYATITFNQIVLSPGDRDAALQLINVYFEMFKELLGEGKPEEVEEVVDEKEADDGKGKGKEKEKGGRYAGKAKGKAKAKEIKGEAGFAEVEDSHSRLISAILTGVNRALPFAKISSADVGYVYFYLSSIEALLTFC